MDERLLDAEGLVDKMSKEKNLSDVEEMIKDNKVLISYKDKQYRIKLLGVREKEELNQLKLKKFGQLIKDKDILLEKDLIQQYKDRGMEFDKSDEEIKKLNAEERDCYIQLGEAISKNSGDTVLKTFEDKIKELQYKKRVLDTQRTLLLQYSLENQLEEYVMKGITYLATEVELENKWVRAFPLLEDFLMCEDEELIVKLGMCALALNYKF